MDNSAKILNVLVSQGIILPCVRINRAIYIASVDYTAVFELEMSFSYMGVGDLPTVVTSTQRVRSTTFIANLDPRWVQARGRNVVIPRQPKAGTTLTASVMVTVKTPAGVRVEHCDAEVTLLPV